MGNHAVPTPPTWMHMDRHPHTAVVVAAAGQGTRFGAAPKIWADLGGRPVLAHVLEVFQPWRTVVVAQAHDHAAVHALGYQVETVEGGATRTQSINKGLLHIQGQGIERVLVHDAARPLVTRALVERLLAALGGVDGVVPVLETTDALWMVEDQHLVAPGDRRRMRTAQTPQAFHYPALLAAHQAHTGPADDDAVVALAAGLRLGTVAGDPRNVKITAQADLAYARFLRTQRG
jgi:2-C-methyl-D-erythritol 4-phosphate cytidylyltransferase / 2-C-methyl-D-erythritol 2,4-cyclodiphosphate synthase